MKNNRNITDKGLKNLKNLKILKTSANDVNHDDQFIWHTRSSGCAGICPANDQTNLPFDIQYSDKPTDHEVDIISKQLQQWTKLNKLDQRVFKLFRNTIKYGDQIFVRDPETFEMYWVDMVKVARVIVNESEGKRPEQYIIRDINPNFQNMSVASKTTQDYYVSRPTGAMGQGNAGTGAGGAGGMLTGTTAITPGVAYTITVGAGGNGASGAVNGNQGSTSSLGGFWITMVLSEIPKSLIILNISLSNPKLTPIMTIFTLSLFCFTVDQAFNKMSTPLTFANLPTNNMKF